MALQGVKIEPLAFSSREAALMLGLSPSMVLKLIRMGRLRSTRVGSRHLILRSELDDLLDKGWSS